MGEGMPRIRARKAITKEPLFRSSDLLNFSSAIFGVIATAIFYLGGWVYISHWYGYFGLDASTLDIPMQLVLIHGFPGLVILISVALITLIVMIISRNLIEKEPLSVSDIPIATLWVYMIVLLSAMYLISLDKNTGAPLESAITLIVIFSFFLFYIVIEAVFLIISFISGNPIYITPLDLAIKIPRIVLRGMIISQMVSEAIIPRNLKELKKIYTFPPREDIQKEITKRLHEYEKEAESRKRSIEKISILTQRMSWGILLVLYFLVTVSTSALLGEWDASRGGRLMVGDWHIPEITLYSNDSLPSLSDFELSTGDYFEYKSLGLLASNEKAFYLVDLKTSDYFTTKPKVYIIPRSDSLFLNFIVTPHARLIPTTTITPATTPAATITPTP